MVESIIMDILFVIMRLLLAPLGIDHENPCRLILPRHENSSLMAGVFVSSQCNGSVWESNPLGALFTPPAGFEDQGRHQPCKHPQCRGGVCRRPRGSIVDRPRPPVYYRWPDA